MHLDADKSVSLRSKQRKATFSGESKTSKYTAHAGSVIGLAFTRDGRNLISYGTDDRVRLWDAESGLNTLVNYGRVDADTSDVCVQMACTDASCLRDFLFVPSENVLLMYDIYSGEEIRKLRGHFETINCCQFNAATNEVYTGSKDRNLLIWSPELTSRSAQASSPQHKRPRLDTNAWASSADRQSYLDNWSDED